MSETATDTAGRIVWFELPAGEPARATAFYGELFGWQFQPFGGEEYQVSEGAGGAVHAEGMGGASGGLLAYFGVDDLAAEVERVRALGGTAGEPQEMPGIGSFAVCADTEGNAFGLYEDGAAEQ